MSGLPAFYQDWLQFALTALPFGVVCVRPYRKSASFRWLDMSVAVLLACAGAGAAGAGAARWRSWAALFAFALALTAGAWFFSLMLARSVVSMRWCYLPGLLASLTALLLSLTAAAYLSFPARSAAGFFPARYAALFLPVGGLVTFAVARMLQKNVPGEGTASRIPARSGCLCVLCLFALAACYVQPAWAGAALALLCLLGCRTLFRAWSGRGGAPESLESVILQEQGRVQALSGQIETARQARHDLRHHLAALRGLAESGDLPAIREYLAQYDERPLAGDRGDWCRNRTVNALARYYLGQARAEGVRLDVQMDIPEQPGIAAPDLCALLGNAFENALEAVRKAPDGRKLIRLRAEDAPGRLTIVMGNSFDGAALRQEGEGYLSGKEEGRVGLGLAGIRRTAEKYGGAARFETAGELFMTSVILFKKDGEV